MPAQLAQLVPDAPAALCAMLDPGSGAVQPPIRSEIFGPQRFAQHGHSLAATHRAASARGSAPNFFPRLRDNIVMLRQAHRYIGVQAATGYDISPAAEWLLDNFHLIEAQLKAIHEGLPRSYFRALPVLLDDPLAGLPRVYGVAWAFVAHTDGAFDDDLLEHFLRAYQQTRDLSLSELWALPTTLRVVLIENLRRLAERVATHKAAREVANLCCDRLDQYDTATLDSLCLLLEQRGVERMFLAQMALRLRDSRGGDNRVPDWLRRQQVDTLALQAQQSADQAADNLSVSNAVTSLRAIGDADWSDIIAATSTLVGLMLTAPTFEAEDLTSRDQTLHAIERWSRRSSRSEVAVARALLELMQTAPTDDVPGTLAGHWLQGPGRPALARALGVATPLAAVLGPRLRALMLPVYLGTLAGGTALLVHWMLWHHGVGSPSWLAALALLVPASETVVALMNRLISESAPPRHLARLALAHGIPPEHRVLVVVPAMLTSSRTTAHLVRNLWLHHLANPERHAQFALLTDWADADNASLPTDQALLDEACTAVQALNLRHPNAADDAAQAPRFIVLHRRRSLSMTEQRWIGWDRKRGKLEQLVALLAAGGTSPFLQLGELSRCAADTRYLLTLDSDTRLPPGRLRELVGIAAHPQNRPQVDPATRHVTSGWAILQPRVVTPLPSRAQGTAYHWLFAGQSGIDPYSAASSEVYQDLFGEGSFTGKGLLHVAAVHAVLGGRLPPERVLSHDLLEGALARCAAVSDVTLVEDAPFHADVAASRMHRWTRGDWQLLPFLLAPRAWPMAGVNRWKIFDNLRRSLVAPLALALLVLALSGHVLAPLPALLLVLAAFAGGPLMGALAGFAPSRDDIAKRHFYRQAALDGLRALGTGFWHLAQLLQQARSALDAIVRALYRLLVSQRHLLQWKTAAAAEAAAPRGGRAVLRAHLAEPLLAAALLGGLLAAGTPWPWAAAALCLLWASAPLFTWWFSRPLPSRRREPLAPAQQALLEGMARDTWRLFERCVVADDRHLPPDNLQLSPHAIVAHRTSPTNIGLYLLSTACARQFGWIGTLELLARVDATLATLLTLQRHRGHFLNWYDTQSGAALLPMYVSTVDSGNLSGHLLAVAQACLELATAPLDPATGVRARQAAAARLQPLLAGRHRGTPDQRDALRQALADHRHMRRSAAADRSADAIGTTARLQTLAEALQTLAWQADFGFLYHAKRHLLHIGYRVAEQQLDAGFYDLLASESRLTSLLAVAKGDVPVRHWSALGRPFYAVGVAIGLRSWAGSMFEYLMPTLVLDEPPGSVLQAACCTALLEQVAWGTARDVPWGVSESAYAASDHTLAYQYAPQGVPRLALRRTPADELVIAPYATMLAAQVDAHQASANLDTLQALGTRHRYGFIEALDFTPARLSGGERFAPVDTFMAHHQGMSIVALANVLLGGVAQRWGMADAHIQAVASLLHEPVPREVSGLNDPGRESRPLPTQARSPGLLREVSPGNAALAPTHLLGNGRYSVTLRANGAGWSRWGSLDISRWRDDVLRDNHGSFLFLRRDRQPLPVSLTQHPAPDPAAHYQSTYHADRVAFDTTWPEIQTRVTVWVSPEDDIEFRQVDLMNLSDRTQDVELMSAFEVSLADHGADEAHPAFANLFVSAGWLEAHQALVFRRQPRLAAEAGLQAAHFLTAGDPQVTGVQVQTDRQLWLGRNRGGAAPQATLMAPPSAAAGQALALDTGLDPMCALAVRLTLQPHSQSRLTFATAASDDGATLHAVIDKYRQPSHVQRASLMSATLSGVRLRALRISADNFAAIQTLSTALVMSVTRPQGGDDGGPEACDRRLLWRFGLSGERPIVLVSAASPQGLGLLRSLVQALRLWAWGGVACDLVVVNAEATSYQMALQRELAALRERHQADSAAQPGPAVTALHVLRAEELSTAELQTLRGLARVRLQADGRPLTHHVKAWAEQHEAAFDTRQGTSVVQLPLTTGGRVALAAPLGRFSGSGGDFGFDVGPRLRPVRPWINVLANPDFGAQQSESGGGYTWAGNSRMNQLTGWSNDPVADPPSEWFLLQDLRTLQTWSVTPSAWGADGVTYRVSHCPGSSRIGHRRGSLDVSAEWCVDSASAVKQVRLRLTNRGSGTLHLRLVAIAEWTLGANRGDRRTVHTTLHRQRLPAQTLTALLATQCEHGAGFGDGTAFLAVAGAVGATEDWTCDRRECFDARGRLVLPDHFGQTAGAGLDPCAALSTRLALPVGDTAERVFLLGWGATPYAARKLAAEAAMVPAAGRLAAVQAMWDGLLGAAQVTTPDPLFDVMVNRWLLYQAVACRLWAKAGFYQAGGATGFRDQLQDTLALAWAAPALLRQQIVLCASRQFPEGDVQHWWHAPGGAGVRTHFSDDLLWLPHACAHYLRASGDSALLDEEVRFIDGPPIPDGAEDAYYAPTVSRQHATVYEHAARTIDRSLRVGVHGLPLMGSGDWNDGMNRVGIEGRGESVWLAWFLCRLVADFAPLAQQRGDDARAARWQAAAAGWAASLESQAWDGQWYRRAFFDDGQVLGSAANPEARIDLIAQAWSVLSGVAPRARQRQAMAALEARLVDPAAGLIRLLDPPLMHATPSAGYIQAYPPGVRENGGQYSHAGVWALMALAAADPDVNGDAVYRDFCWLSPAHRAAEPRQGPVYGLEPYAMAGDVYSQPPYVGRGGWSWYTGAAAWLQRAAIESIFGLQLQAGTLCLQPCLPPHWQRAELRLRRDGRSLHFTLLRSATLATLLAEMPAGTDLLWPGQALAWLDLGPELRYVVPLLAASSETPTAPDRQAGALAV